MTLGDLANLALEDRQRQDQYVLSKVPSYVVCWWYLMVLGSIPNGAGTMV